MVVRHGEQTTKGLSALRSLIRFHKQLCPHCKNGKRTYELDEQSPMCPYLACHNGKTYAMFEKLKMPEEKRFWNRIKKLFGTK